MQNIDLSLEDQTEQQAQRAEDERVKRQIEIDDFKFVMAHKQSRRFVWRLLASYGIYQSTFSVNHAEASFKEGERNCGLRLLRDIHRHAPERYIELLTEIKDDNRKHSNRSTGSDDHDGSARSKRTRGDDPGSIG